MRKGFLKLTLISALGVFALPSAVHAAMLLSFDALPTSPNLPEFVFTNAPVPDLVGGSGATGNGLSDGLLPHGAQAVGGLEIQTPLHVLGPSAMPLSNGGTEFDDVTLIVSDFAASAPASDPGTGVITQPLGKANSLAPTPTFSIYGTSIADTNPLHGQLLLTGTISVGAITALNGSDSGSVLSATVAYNGGAIYNALIAGGGTPIGSLSWSLLDVMNNSGQPNITIDPISNFFVPFTANGTGQFSVSGGLGAIPEPASFALVLPLAIAAVSRRRRR